MKEKAFDPNFEDKLIQTILVDHDFGEQIFEVLDSKYFDQAHAKAFADLLRDYYYSYEAFPSTDLIPEIIESKITKELVAKKCKVFLKQIQKKPLNGDIQYVKDKSLEFFRLQNIYQTLDKEVIPRIEKGSGKLEEIVPLIENAVNKGLENDTGYNYLDDFEDRFNEENIKVIPTQWDVLNKILKGGGLGEGRLYTFVACPGSGKSTILVGLGKAALLQGKTVLHYTFEIDKYEVAEKYDASITGIKIDNLIENKEQVLYKLKKKIPQEARLIIKEYPVRGASIQTIKAHLSKLKLKNIIPDFIIIDQGGNLKSVQKNKEERYNLADNWLDMKNLAQTYKIPVATAHQANRNAYREEILLPDNIAGCWDLIGTTDFLLTMARNVEQKSAGIGKMYLSKNRRGKDGFILGYFFNGEMGQVDIVEHNQEFETLLEEEKIKQEERENFTLQGKIKKFLKDKNGKEQK